jgi:hypothetical protein
VDLAGLLAELAAFPHLTGAACRGRAAMFDGRTPRAVAEAQAICFRCPALSACRTWLAATPVNRRPSGVIAGQLVKPRTGAGNAAWLPAMTGRRHHHTEPGSRPAAPRRDQAAAFLARALADGPVRIDDLAAAAHAAGIGRHQLYRARPLLGVRMRQDGRHSYWIAPPRGRPSNVC